MRKLNQLPYHLIEAGELTTLKTQALCNYAFLMARLNATTFGYVDFNSCNVFMYSILKDLYKKNGSLDLRLFCS